MTDKTITFEIDGVEVQAKEGQTIMAAADAVGKYIPRLCAFEGLPAFGSCRICTVKVNGRFQAACIHPVSEGIMVENDTDELLEFRRNIVDMLFVEGNHFCMFCEKSGNCELQAMAYRLGIAAPKYPYMFPDDRKVDGSHKDIILDHNRCILCARCVRASRDIDGKNVFQFVGRGAKKHIAVNAHANLVDTDIDVTDKAVDACPVGAILKKHVGYAIPVGQRKYDHEPIGSDIEANKQ